ncbi:MAG TPA: SDR family NAD(P)-dependent oxidoreductase, partial [Bryobacteraceae bacterium]|nr:SDR family NAD(P)-dependent oxidoreductase [Bryobacteraceae bacterium]
MRLPLPTYPFEQTRYWVGDGEDHRNQRSRTAGPGSIHPFLDTHIVLARQRDTHIFEGEISIARFPYLADHRVQGRAVFPAAAYSELAVATKRIAFGAGPVALENVEYQSPILLDDGNAVQIQVVIERSDEANFDFSVFSRPVETGIHSGAESKWRAHAAGKLRSIPEAPDGTLTTEAIEAIKARCKQEIEGSEFYRKLAEKGNQWGTSFQGVERIWRGDGEVLGRISLTEAVRSDFERYECHPAVADACGQPVVATVPLERTEGPQGGAFVGGSIDEARLYTALRGNHFWVHARLREESGDSNILIGDLRVMDESLRVVMELRGLHLWYLNESATQGTADWIYSLAFEAVQEQPAFERSGDRQLPAESRRWIILADEQGIGARLGKTLEAQGDEVVCLYRKRPGDRSPDKAGEQWVSPEELDAVLASLDQRSGAGYHSIVHLWALDGQAGEEASANELETSLALGAENALLCMKALARGVDANAPRLWLVTRAAQSVHAEDGPADPSHTAIWGLARTFAVEHPSLWGGIVDLPKQGSAEPLLVLLASAIRKPVGEDQLALRDGRLLAARLARVQLSPLAHRFRWLADATYVITGGFGGLGLALATWLIQQGVRHLALIGHSPLPPREKWDSVAEGTREARRIAAIRHLEELGAKVYVCCADVGSEESLASCMNGLGENGRPAVRGVIHAAGVLGYKPIQETTVDEFRELLHAKAVGGWLLHKWSLRRELDCFVTFSSAAAVLNSPFVAGYAAANAFLDGLAHSRRQQGLTALSINWGLWSGVGMSEFLTESELEIVNSRGMGAIPADLGLETFGRLV